MSGRTTYHLCSAILAAVSIICAFLGADADRVAVMMLFAVWMQLRDIALKR